MNKKAIVFIIMITLLSFNSVLYNLVGFIKGQTTINANKIFAEDAELTDCRYYSEISTEAETELTTLHSPGRIHIQDNYFFVCDEGYGIHIYDFSSLEIFEHVATIGLPFNSTFTVRGDFLYADNMNNLMVFNISYPENPEYVKTIEDVFFKWSIEAYDWDSYIDADGNYISADSLTFYTQDVYNDKCTNNMPEIEYYYDYYDYDSGFNCGFGCALDGDSSASIDSSYSGNAAGSLASIVMVENYLYVINSAMNLVIYDVEDVDSIAVVREIEFGDLETVYPFENYMFFGGVFGTYIYDAINPSNPIYISEFEHTYELYVSCDPVVVSGNYAYVTLRSGSYQGETCGHTTATDSELDILSIEDIENPELISSYHNLEFPMGLGVAENIVYLCDPYMGLLVLDTINKENPVLVDAITNISPIDVIYYYNKLFVTGDDGIHLYDVSESLYEPVKLMTLKATDLYDYDYYYY